MPTFLHVFFFGMLAYFEDKTKSETFLCMEIWKNTKTKKKQKTREKSF